jgi:hypothetical protein
VLGIYAVLAPNFGDFQGKVLATSGCVTGAGLLTFVCLPALEQGRARVLPLLGIGASLLGFSLGVFAIWSDRDGETYGELVASVFVVAGAAVLSSVLSLARLAPRYRLVQPAATVLAFVLAAFLVSAITGGPWGSGAGRVAGVVGVLLGATTLAVPILHRASRAELAGAPGPAREVRFCPSCGAAMMPPTSGEGACARCGARFRVTFVGMG